MGWVWITDGSTSIAPIYVSKQNQLERASFSFLLLKPDICRVGVTVECDLENAVIETRPRGLIIDVCWQISMRYERA